MNRFKQYAIAGLALPAALTLAACQEASSPVAGPAEETKTIIDTAREAGTFNTLLTALDAADLTEALEGDGPFTVFAPTDAAFAQVDPELLTDLLSDNELLTSVLTYHVIPEEVPATAAMELDHAPTLNEKDLPLTRDGGQLFVDGAGLMVTDIEASNGIIHVIDAVLTPEPIADIVQTARAAGNFSTLLAAVEAAGLTGVLKGDGPLTVFAPTDEAFAAIPAENLSALLADRDALVDILTYHVVPARYLASDVVKESSLPTANGASASISLGNDGSARIDNALITAVDIEARNGIIHVIDQVIFPQ